MPIAPPATSQFQSFSTNIEYARKMQTAGKSLDGLQPGALDVTDLYRAAWVQAVSAVDHWLHEELFRRVAELAADSDANMPEQLRRFELPLSVIEAVRRDELPLADAVVNQVRGKWAYLPLHNPKKISEAYRLVTDANLWERVADQLNEWHYGTTNYNAQKVKKRFSEVIERRNKIAHYADLEDGDLKQRRSITAADAEDAIAWLERIVLGIATVLG